jgi:4-amino-4-deoxy-L-arabinose transferase-like glycosyltransferase
LIVSRWRIISLTVLILVVATGLRTLWLRADPPTTSVGVVWHDEGAWVHNARNKALWGSWRTDAWNPVYIAPVFTALEYGAFEAFGVGTWQARTVPVASGLAAVLLLMAGLSAIAGPRVALVGGALAATNYIFVMWNRAALMESTMTAFIVASWAAYARAGRRPVWGFVAGLAAVLAFFTKAAAAFFVAALVLDAIVSVARRNAAGGRDDSRAAWMTLAGLALATAVVAAVFVLPHLTEYRFYNWEMSVTRKPSYAVRDLIDRASWIPVVQDFFSRMWLVVVGGAIGLAAIVARWRSSRPGERLLVLWVLVGLLELAVHDSGNERRYVMFIPALIALAVLLVASDRPWLPASLGSVSARARWLAVPLLLLVGYLVFGSVVRLAFLGEIRVGVFSTTVRLSAALAVLATALLLWKWKALVGRLSARQIPTWVVGSLVAVSLAWNLGEYSAWARRHTELNYRASIEVGQLLAPGTLVQGKLANGLSLENRIRPIFVGRGFGNYADRLTRDDARYILTYVLPSQGYESQEGSGLIQEILARYPNHRTVREFDVDETPDRDRAALIDKFPHARD